MKQTNKKTKKREKKKKKQVTGLGQEENTKQALPLPAPDAPSVFSPNKPPTGKKEKKIPRI